jgi:hypothetical protein
MQKPTNASTLPSSNVRRVASGQPAVEGPSRWFEHIPKLANPQMSFHIPKA